MSEPEYWFDAYHTHAAAGVVLLTKDERLVLQLRDDKPDIENPGMITAFAGGAEPGETPVDCALRELAEETGIRARGEDIHRLGAISKVSFRGDPTASVFFLLTGVDPTQLVITEGTMVLLSLEEAVADPRLTEISRVLVEKVRAMNLFSPK
ncbi:NUDIX domain-containing protein [Dongia sedimenti]|uniref:NUDIX domain-containing protein n=1 Tax=Dongia sedimenti TaxID=3064282 RepID=A0ABU0YJL3_9PROT|nr:NUDIX domain-containing protein [Rhodospirillaceae bacterium R-7]